MFAFRSPELKTFHVKRFRFIPQSLSGVFRKIGETVTPHGARIARNRAAASKAPGFFASL
jgi:hypothetical protein